MTDASANEHRRRERHDFARRCGLGAWTERLLAGDASQRKYWRWSDGQRSIVVMDAPPPQENVRAYARVARHLITLGLSGTEIHAEDAENGFLLVEDFGDLTYGNVLGGRANAGSRCDERSLYGLAIDVLAHLHRCGDRALIDGLPVYLGARMAEFAALLVDWYLPQSIGRPASNDERAAYVDAWLGVLPALEALPRTLALRDYHADNLMWLPERPGVRACGLLDIQDAEIGVATFDIVSLLEDARRDVSAELHAASLQRYASLVPAQDRAAFDTALAVCAAQRHCRILGIFARLDRRDGKPHYLKHLPRVWRLLDRALAHPELVPVRQWIAHHLPPQRRWIPVT